MKALFLIFHGFEEANGISKKIRYQIKALKACGLEVDTCWLDDAHDHKRRMINDTILNDYGTGFKGKILKRIEYGSIIKHVRENNITVIYVRYVHNASPFTIRLMKQLKKTGAYIVMEIPTYPYDQEYKGLPLPYQRILFFDKCFRKRLAHYVDKIVTFSDYDQIWGRPTIKISNGIDFSQIKIKQSVAPHTDLRLIAVATIHPWHGFDRAIEGLALYYQKNPVRKVYIHIIGSAVPEVLSQYQQSVRKNRLEQYVFFHGSLFGEALDKMFDESDFGIGSLARHRSQIDKIKTLKNREYAARGIPFVYSETDDDFEKMPYILKAPADETPLDIEKIIDFYDSIRFTPKEIRSSIEKTLSWKRQMQYVIEETFKRI
ncbi:glycosyltransferase family 4 protein [Bacteroides fragilis]|uniref:glycosyltransferase family 4 protein n=1 Tax=Bacteroides fragilis TaxID=817 RepID=UPI000C77020D|nr:glycosyltransferase family 4 protein [Bacteroides fragilis]AUI46341.1 glycosyltransferase [Bacteroides fragilis]MCE8557294.1 glycosyltransferase family 4 protein [Bacteroides fragilis]